MLFLLPLFYFFGLRNEYSSLCYPLIKLLHGPFMKYFSPEVRDAVAKAGNCAVGGGSVEGCAREGLFFAANSLANYSLNFFDEGSL